MAAPLITGIMVAIDLLTAINALAERLGAVSADIAKARSESRELTDAEVDKHAAAAAAARAVLDVLIETKTV